MILEIDVGNTRLKWRWLDADGEVVVRGAEAYNGVEWSVLWSAIAVSAVPSDVRIVNVSSPEVSKRLYESCYLTWQLRPRFAKVESECAGVINGYDEPLRLGVDRWLVLLAAYALYPAKPCVVIDCGSAVTVDVLAKNGQHLGGYIVPGANLMRKSLFADTTAVKVSDLALSCVTNPGTSTDQAVSHGVILMITGLCREVVNNLCCKQGWLRDEINLLITGGDGEVVRSAIDMDIEYWEDLVFDGLSLCSFETSDK